MRTKCSDAATEKWQTAHGQDADGAVGFDTFGAAGRKLSSSDGALIVQGAQPYAFYTGGFRTVTFTRDVTTGAYGVAVSGGYTTASCASASS
ncbi:hypothetical protein ABT115_19710 [Streptomyces sp. NPDC001832]|uniref:hypothetical protein n=1 Tax=Streptomyces sp. NPDC001832 TaxID=3154527 RepID=UPI003331E509